MVGDLQVWFSELNYWMTKYYCESLSELEDTLFYDYGVTLEVL